MTIDEAIREWARRKLPQLKGMKVLEVTFGVEFYDYDSAKPALTALVERTFERQVGRKPRNKPPIMKTVTENYEQEVPIEGEVRQFFAEILTILQEDGSADEIRWCTAHQDQMVHYCPEEEMDPQSPCSFVPGTVLLYEEKVDA